MADDHRLDRRTLVILGLAALLALRWVGLGPVNGDQAVYLHQAASGALFERWTHVGWVAALTVLGGFGADLVNLGLGLGVIGWLGRRDWRAAALAAGCVLPWLPFGEVDVPWLAAWIAAQAWPALGGVAVALSPTVLAALAWQWHERSTTAVWMVVAALGLAAVSTGDWLWGTRGVLELHWQPAPLAHLPWLVVPVGLAVAGGADVRRGLWLLPALLAPSDVPAWWVVLPWAVPAIENGRLTTGAVLAQLIAGTLVLEARGGRLVDENLAIARAAEVVRDGDALDASWSLGVRISLEVSGDPYGLPRMVTVDDPCDLPARIWTVAPPEPPVQREHPCPVPRVLPLRP